ncbi:MAG: hypothetical protein AAF743_09955 [Planctomycetota bacterium]
MIKRIPITEAKESLVDLVRELGPDDLVLLTDGDRIAARLEQVEYDASGHPLPPRRRAGWAEGSVEIVDESDDEVVRDFEASANNPL